jgi:hypothetical protein
MLAQTVEGFFARSMALTIVFGVIGGVLLLLVGIVGFLFYRGYGKIRGKELDGAYISTSSSSS